MRTVPPWVRSVNRDTSSDRLSLDTSPLRPPQTPTDVHLSPKHNAAPGRRYDHARDRLPPLPSAPLAENASRWRAFAHSSAYPGYPPGSAHSEIVSQEWMRENMGDLDEPWQPPEELTPDQEKEPGFWLFSPEKRRGRLNRIHRILMRNPYVPLIIRLNVLVFSLAALGLSARIFHLTHHNSCNAGSSTYMAIIVDVIAIVYLLYITYDEYTARPLGLRNPKSKMRLILMDLAFIVFDSANLSIAFQSLTDSNWACVDQSDPNDPTLISDSNSNCFNNNVCGKQKALTAVLLLALVAWLSTFAISTLRVVERVSQSGGR
ncbi:hypothetical protein K490DRAFT_37644 [Saccharata proteae CBS 121410]|uniref:Regulator of phospholipase D SRF1 n=1 Tax=Saccharata proteae CBS 121410 TaxID=1314787 RepID=A0A6A5YDA9_9PEZI|nr:hypothetical protein K490DRAFT_37644 [Saccharata proteae CBS 121410]